MGTQLHASQSGDTATEQPMAVPSGVVPDATGWWSHLTFGWLSPLMHLGRRTPLELSHLPYLTSDHAARKWARRFKHIWDAEVAALQLGASTPPYALPTATKGRLVVRALVRLNWDQIFIIVGMAVLCMVLNFTRVFALRFLIQHLESAPAQPDNVWVLQGVAWSFWLAISSIAALVSWFLMCRREEVASMHVRPQPRAEVEWRRGQVRCETSSCVG